MVKSFFSTAIILILFISCAQDNKSPVLDQWIRGEAPNNAAINYPFDGAVFPADFPPPTVRWSASEEKAGAWIVFAARDGKILASSEPIETNNWKISADMWAEIKEASKNKPFELVAIGYDKSSNKAITSGKIEISISSDKVDAPIVYRTFPPHFAEAMLDLEKISWRIGYPGSNDKPLELMSGKPMCSGCHSFSKDGGVIGMDIDFGNPKGSYLTSKIEPATTFNSSEILSWQKLAGGKSYGFMSNVSPDGKYVAACVRDKSVFVGLEDASYSKLFFPVKGVLGVYDRKSKKFAELPGANNPEYVQCNPEWSPDGKRIIFARAKSEFDPKIETIDQILLPTEFAMEYIMKEKTFKYDLYEIDFNGGRGGEAKPIQGASNTETSEYFPKISPDGETLVFCRSENFMALQQDSKLYIVSARGGEAKLMNCNLPGMNSWHSWSPNGKWLAFASKNGEGLTRIYLTRINENGVDSPPVEIENFRVENASANMPEFVDIEKGGFEKIVDKFSSADAFNVNVGASLLKQGKQNEAITKLDEAIKRNPDDFELYNSRAVAYFQMEQFDKAIIDIKKSVSMKSGQVMPYMNLGNAYFFKKEYALAVDAYTKAIENNPSTDPKVHHNRGAALLNLGKFREALADYEVVLEIQKTNPRAFFERGICKLELGMKQDACNDFFFAAELGMPEAQQYFDENCQEFID